MFDIMGMTAAITSGYNEKKIKELEKEIKNIKLAIQEILNYLNKEYESEIKDIESTSERR